MTASNTKQSLHSKPTPQRDGYIDFFKGLLILWVIQIHTVFWSGADYIPENIRQTSLLVDVTTFFFISGYLTKPVGLIAAFKNAAKQFKNLYLNYIGLSLLLLGPLSVAYSLRKKIFPDLHQAIVFMLSVLKLEGEGDVWGAIPVYRGSFWYLWVYFSLLVVLPFLISCFESRKSRIAILISLLALIHLSTNFSWNFSFLFTNALSIYFYAFIYLLGMAYRIDKDSISTRWIELSFLANISLAISLFFYVDKFTLNLQTEKFPPSLKYLVYSLLLIHIFVILQRMWNYPKANSKHVAILFLEWCGRNSYFIYLLQGIVTSIPLYFSGLLINRVADSVVYSIILVFNVCFTLLSTFVYLNFKSKLLSLVKSFLNRKSE